MSEVSRVRAGALTLFALALTISGSSSAAAPVREALRPQTLVTLPTRIRGFAQDGSRVAWLTGTDRRRCTRTLHVRSLTTKLTQTSRQAGCMSNASYVSGVALARSAAAWDSFVAASKSGVGEAIVTAGVPGRAHRIASIHGSHSTVAAAGNLLAFSTPTGVRRIVNGKARRSFRFSHPLALAVDKGRIAAVGQELRAGDGCGCASSPDWRADGKIGFLSQLSLPPQGKKEITLIDPSGTGRTLITDDDRWRFDLDWSLDGTKLAYSYTGNGITVAVAASDGSGVQDVGPGYEPALSRDGSKVAFARYNGDFFLYVANADGGDEQLLGPGFSPAWSPDGARLAFTASDGRLWVIDVHGANAHQLGSLEGSGADWSSDGTKLAYSSHGIWVADADGSNPRQLTFGPDLSPHWSPDGRALVFERNRELFIVNADATGLRPLTLTVPAGRASVGELHAATGRRISSFEAPGAAAGVALAGAKVAVGTRGSAGRGLLTLFAADTGKELASAALPGKAPTVVGANARWVVFRTGARTIEAYDLRTSTTRTLAVPPVAPIGLSVSGARVAWAENLASGGRIRALTLPA
jgi:WD40-like Beta Propeller Repeat